MPSLAALAPQAGRAGARSLRRRRALLVRAGRAGASVTAVEEVHRRPPPTPGPTAPGSTCRCSLRRTSAKALAGDVPGRSTSSCSTRRVPGRARRSCAQLAAAGPAGDRLRLLRRRDPGPRSAGRRRGRLPPRATLRGVRPLPDDRASGVPRLLLPEGSEPRERGDPGGWPAEIPPPGAAGWERRAIAWLYDLCPPDHRGYAVLPALAGPAGPRRRRERRARRSRRAGTAPRRPAPTCASSPAALPPEAVDALLAMYEREALRLDTGRPRGRAGAAGARRAALHPQALSDLAYRRHARATVRAGAGLRSWRAIQPGSRRPDLRPVRGVGAAGSSCGDGVRRSQRTPPRPRARRSPSRPPRARRVTPTTTPTRRRPATAAHGRRGHRTEVARRASTAGCSRRPAPTSTSRPSQRCSRARAARGYVHQSGALLRRAAGQRRHRCDLLPRRPRPRLIGARAAGLRRRTVVGGRRQDRDHRLESRRLDGFAASSRHPAAAASRQMVGPVVRPGQRCHPVALGVAGRLPDGSGKSAFGCVGESHRPAACRLLGQLAPSPGYGCPDDTCVRRL